MTCNDRVKYDTCGIPDANACCEFQFDEEHWKAVNVYLTEDEGGQND